jgi:basic amino acid/polyamine antiporter, APA family
VGTFGPRATFALAEQGDFPLWFAAVHPKFRTPHVSILVFATLVWLLALFGSFAWNVTLAATTKLFYYGLICGAVPVLRRKQPAAASFQIPGGPAFAVLGVLICVILFAAVDFSKSLILATTFSIALVNWLLVRRVEPVFSVTR